MKRLNRLKLSEEAMKFLSQRTAKVDGAAVAAKEAKRLWKFRDALEFKEIRAQLERMASGLQRCMYCEDSQGTDIDHFWPRAAYPLRAFLWENYLLACSTCNSNFKRSQFPLDQNGEPLLINPTAEDPLEHLVLAQEGKFLPLTPKGESSVEVFGLDRTVLVQGRKNAWTGLQELLTRYEARKRKGDLDLAEAISASVRQYPFASVLVSLLRAAGTPKANLVVHRECLAALDSCPEIFDWV